MTKESTFIFLRFGLGFFALLGTLVAVNVLAGKAGVTGETPWSSSPPSTRDAHEGRTVMERNGCFSCHSVDGFGGSIGPVLNGVGRRKTRDELFGWIQSPWSVKPGTRMPQYHLSAESISNIISYLETKDSMQVNE